MHGDKSLCMIRALHASPPSPIPILLCTLFTLPLECSLSVLESVLYRYLLSVLERIKHLSIPNLFICCTLCLDVLASEERLNVIPRVTSASNQVTVTVARFTFLLRQNRQILTIIFKILDIRK